MPTILDQLCSELRNDLSFYHKGVKNVTRPGLPHRVGDQISFDVFVKNRTNNIIIKNVTGWVKHAAATSFTSMNYTIPILEPGGEKSLGPTIKAEVVANTNDIMWFDKIALIDTTAEADLTKIRFNDSGILIDNIQNA